jgi:ParB family chromosome partitioning protein
MNQPNKRDSLGKGIRSLLQNIDSDLKTTAGSLKHPIVETATGVNRIPIDNITINPK